MTELQQLVDKSISDRKLNYFDFDHLYRFSFWSVKMSCFTLSRVTPTFALVNLDEHFLHFCKFL